MTEQSDAQGSKPLPKISVLVLLILIIYVLSIGPVIAVVEKTNAPKEPFEILYAPVIWLHNHTFLEKPLEKYGEMWGWR